jgi:hypothetical protein
MDQGLGWMCAGSDEAGVEGKGLLGSRPKYAMRLSESRRRDGVAKPPLEGESTRVWGPVWPKQGAGVSPCLCVSCAVYTNRTE